MMKKYLISIFLILAMCICRNIPAYADSIKIAFIDIENQTKDPHYDYIEGIVRGILLFDLAQSQDIEIVERGALAQVLKEQALQTSDLVSESTAARIGNLIGATYPCSKAPMFSWETAWPSVIQLVSVETGKVLPFNVQGSSENVIHSLAEQIIKRLTGKSMELTSELHERSILSLHDEKPGSIDLYCPLPNAEIFFDNEFAGYTRGDGYTAIKLENLSPGKHKLRVHLKGFGEITMPEITFQDWERDVLIQPGKQAAVKSMVVKYSNSLQEIIEVLHVIERLDFPKGNNVYKKEHQISFQDRKGNPVTLALSVEANASPEQARLSAVFLYNGQEQRRNFICAVGKEETVTINAGVTALVLTLDFQGTGYCRILYDIERTDVTDAEFKK